MAFTDIAFTDMARTDFLALSGVFVSALLFASMLLLARADRKRSEAMFARVRRQHAIPPRPRV